MEFDISKFERLTTKIPDNSNNISFQLGGRTITALRAPTQNCQFYSIGCAMRILDYANFPKIFAVIHNVMMKKRMLIDVPRSYCGVIEKFFDKKDIVFRQDYINSTYSTAMSMYMLATDKIAVIGKELIVEAANKQRKETLAAQAAKVTKVNPFPEEGEVIIEPVVKRRVGRPKKIVEAPDNYQVINEPGLAEIIADQQRMVEEERIADSVASDSALPF